MRLCHRLTRKVGST